VSENGTVVKMTLKAGDTVLYGKYSGTEINLEDNDVLIMRESDILAKFK
jgi:chaperonin GroES